MVHRTEIVLNLSKDFLTSKHLPAWSIPLRWPRRWHRKDTDACFSKPWKIRLWFERPIWI